MRAEFRTEQVKGSVESLLGLVACVSSLVDAAADSSSVGPAMEKAVKLGKDCAKDLIGAIADEVHDGLSSVTDVLAAIPDTEKSLLQGFRLAGSVLRGDSPARATMTATPVALPKVVTELSYPRYAADSARIRPGRMDVFEGTGFGSLKWSEWTSTTATASGTESSNTCDPDCASANYTSGPVRLQLSAPAMTCGALFFTRLSVESSRGRNDYDIAPDYPTASAPGSASQASC